MEIIPEQVDGNDGLNEYTGIWLGNVILACEGVAHCLGMEFD